MSTATHPPTSNWPGYWFLRLEAAIEGGDYAAAAAAQRQLERLGVEVRYPATAAAKYDTVTKTPEVPT